MMLEVKTLVAFIQILKKANLIENKTPFAGAISSTCQESSG